MNNDQKKLSSSLALSLALNKGVDDYIAGRVILLFTERMEFSLDERAEFIESTYRKFEESRTNMKSQMV